MDRRRARWILQTGAVFRKFSKRGFPHKRKVWLDTEKWVILWGDPSAKQDKALSFGVNTITDVVPGVESAVFKANKRSFRYPSLCFSIVTTDRTLDLECENETVYDDWMGSLALLLQHRRLL